MPPIVRVVGPSGAGKTTVIEKLIPELKSRGLRVGSIKHASHGYEADRPGSDSARHTAAGAEPVLLVDGHRAMLFTPELNRAEASPASLSTLVARWFRDVDVVLAEGFLSADPEPAIVVHRHGLEPRRPDADAVVLGALTDVPLGYEPELDPRDPASVPALAELVIAAVRAHDDPGVSVVVGGRCIEVKPPLAAELASAVRTLLADAAVEVPVGPVELHLDAEP